jgi:dihydrofolate reductase
MSLTLIAAVARNGIIGNQNSIPWHVPADFKHFSATTRDHAVIMGRNTWNSLPEKFRPLPKRLNIIVTRNPEGGEDANDTHFVPTIEAGISLAREVYGQEEIFVIGGTSIYEQTIDLADRLLISEIPMEPEGDALFPKIGPEWEQASRTEMDGFSLLEFYRK